MTDDIKTDKDNPANERPKAVVDRKIIPMSAGQKRLDVPERPGYYRRWFRGDPGRIARAKQAGYEFVDASDVEITNFDLGGNASTSGNTDMGTRVSVVSGDTGDENGNPMRLYLMEVPNEYYEQSKALIEERNDGVAAALSQGILGADNERSGDQSKRYVKTKVPDLFRRKN